MAEETDSSGDPQAVHERRECARHLLMNPLTCAEHFFGGLLTTSMFALMMSSVDRRIGATHFTLLASVEVIGKSAPGLLSGFFVDKVGFQPVFAASVVLSLLFLLVVPRVPEHFEPASPTA